MNRTITTTEQLRLECLRLAGEAAVWAIDGEMTIDLMASKIVAGAIEYERYVRYGGEPSPFVTSVLEDDCGVAA